MTRETQCYPRTVVTAFEIESIFLSSGNEVPIQAAVLNRFGEMGGLDVFLAFQVGNGPGDL